MIIIEITTTTKHCKLPTVPRTKAIFNFTSIYQLKKAISIESHPSFILPSIHPSGFQSQQQPGGLVSLQTLFYPPPRQLRKLEKQDPFFILLVLLPPKELKPLWKWSPCPVSNSSTAVSHPFPTHLLLLPCTKPHQTPPSIFSGISFRFHICLQFIFVLLDDPHHFCTHVRLLYFGNY